uniref:SAM domain, SH3 domain and nuclear localisation signals 1b n=1 Tax=Scleropages formosus TaxID=113540 RepID=A0A8C9V8V8_SCLFO
MSCMGLGKRTEKKSSKEAQVQTSQGAGGGRAGGGLYATWDPGSHSTQQRWSNLSEFPATWDYAHHTCIRTLDLHRPRVYDFNSPRDGDCHATETDPLPPQIACSITDLDVCDGTRSTSFGRFDSFRHSSPSKHDENEANLHTEGQQMADGSDQGRTRVLGKMKAISLTMRKRMGRKYAKALSEDMGEEIEREQEAEADGGQPLDRGCRRSSNSLESLYSLNSGRSSSSGITSGSDGSSNRESLRVEEELPYTGHICGRARVHTDFVPSPYDTDSLRLKVGDIIDVISKPPMGIWTGVLNNKVGNFKFIYVDLIEEQRVPQKSGCQKTGPNRQSILPTTKTLQELLDSLHLEEYTSSLLLNGYQTVEDLKELKEQHLIELDMTDLEHRSRLLAAVDCLLDAEGNEEEGGEDEKKGATESRLQSENRKDNPSDCPRDSGCYVTPEGSDNGKDDTYGHAVIAERPLGES